MDSANHEARLAADDLACERSDRVLFSGLKLEVREGEALQVHGPNGSGKTSLLRILCGLVLPSAGTVRWRGVDILTDPLGYRAEILYIGHHSGVKLELSPLENLKVAQALAAQPNGVTPLHALERFGLAGFEDTPARALSAGQRRRIALARLLTNQARIWVLDEPFTALDRAGVKTMESIIHAKLRAGGLLIVTTHQPIRLGTEPAKALHLSP
ncbi:MAG: cytochrome c biogenesis heme-transporting ATPase CcmA [Gammaproteobacteria bacterium]